MITLPQKPEMKTEEMYDNISYKNPYGDNVKSNQQPPKIKFHRAKHWK